MPHAITKRNAEESPLLSKLPPELRNKIYGMVLITDRTIVLRSTDYTVRKALLNASLQIHREASKMFWSGNRFIVTSIAIDIKTECLPVELAGYDIAQSISKLIIEVEPNYDYNRCWELRRHLHILGVSDESIIMHHVRRVSQHCPDKYLSAHSLQLRAHNAAEARARLYAPVPPMRDPFRKASGFNGD
jgi:hypothetical protein